MRALVCEQTAVRLDVNRRAPQALPGEAVLTLAKAAVSSADVQQCRSLMRIHGNGPAATQDVGGLVPGRQFVAVVESVSGAAAARLVGKRVVGSPVTACGKCDMCSRGVTGHCRNRTIMGVTGRGGCLAERFTLPVANLVLVPEPLDNDHAVFAVELAAAIQAAQQIAIAGKPYITVLGDGELALLTAQVMAKLNASVRVVGTSAQQLALCEKWGIKHRLLDDVGRRADQDIVVDCSGGTARGAADGGMAGLRTAIELVRPRGKIVLKSPVPCPFEPSLCGDMLAAITMNEIEVIGSFAGPIGEALHMLSRREVDVVSLISRRMGLGDGAAIFRAATQPGIITVLIEP